jgi:cytidine deaminase
MQISSVTEEEIAKMIEVAKGARENSMAYKSKINFGASVLTESGECYGGCNVDGIISGEGICGERLAMFHAVAHGKYRLKGICVYGERAGYPCGICLQMATMFCQIRGGDISIIVASEDGKYEVSSVMVLLPKGYRSRSYAKEIESFSKK